MGRVSRECASLELVGEFKDSAVAHPTNPAIRDGRVKRAEQNAGMVAVDPLVRRFNSLNATIGAMVPAVAIAQDTLQRVVPLLRQMQRVLSQRPRGARGSYRMLHRIHGRILGATFIERSEDIPTWSNWLAAYALEIGYSARQLRRLMFNEPPAAIDYNRRDVQATSELFSRDYTMLRNGLFPEPHCGKNLRTLAKLTIRETCPSTGLT
jgi:hypothetical protein